LDASIYIDSNPVNYESFFDSSWAQEISDLSEKDKELDKIVINLLVNIKSAIYTACAPLLQAKSFSLFHDSLVNSPDKPNSIFKFCHAITDRLTENLDEITESVVLQHKIKKRASNVRKDLAFGQEYFKIQLPPEEVWHECLKDPSFQLIVWSSQRQAFVSNHSTYEHFIVDILRLKLNDPNYRKQSESKFQKEFLSAFPEDTLLKTWTNKVIKQSRMARNCLAHGSGVVSKELSKQDHNFQIVDNKIQITPKDLINQFFAIKTGALHLVKEFLKAEEEKKHGERIP
jgi:hypothetical protein